MKLIAITSLVLFVGIADVIQPLFGDINLPFSHTVSIQDRVEVDLKDVPEKVRTSVGDGTEMGWKIYRAYLVTNDDKTQYYELYVRKMEEETVMKVDKNGQVLN